MAKPIVSDELWAVVEPLLPPEPERPRGGRPRISNRDCLRGIIFVLRASLPWSWLQPEMGCSFRHDLLAALEGMARGRRLAQAAPGAARTPRRRRPTRLVTGLGGLLHGARSRGGAKTGANPTDRGKPGTKRHLVVEARGIPLAVALSAANVHDSRMMLEVVDAIEPIRRGRRGRPRKRPLKLHADKAYDSAPLREELRGRGITPRIARRGIESSERLGRHRWVVERTLAWPNRYRRLRIRYERRADMHRAFLHIGCALICCNFINH